MKAGNAERPGSGGGPQRVLCIVASKRELDLLERALARHTERGDAVTVLVLSRGAAPRGASDPTKPSTGRAMIELDLEQGTLGSECGLVARLKQVLADTTPDLVYAPSPFGRERDDRAAGRALASALCGGPARTVAFARAEGFVEISSREIFALSGREADFSERVTGTRGASASPRATAVVSTWNKKDDVRANLESLRAQTLPFLEIVVVDNASRDGTAQMIAQEFPEVRLIVMPHDRYGACETFNIGFASSTTELTAILDDDIVMPPEWLEKATARIAREPATTAILSTQVVEPGTPQRYLDSVLVNSERYMSTFRGCASLARTNALREAGYYDERLFIYGNERDLTCRLLNLGYRVLQYPGCAVFHKTPFGIKMGKRSLYYHARNAWLSMLKYAPLGDLVRMPWLVFSKVILRGEEKEAEGAVSDAVGTIGIGRSLRETKGAWWIVTKAAFSVLWNVPYCLKHRQPVKAPDFELPLH